MKYNRFNTKNNMFITNRLQDIKQYIEREMTREEIADILEIETSDDLSREFGWLNATFEYGQEELKESEGLEIEEIFKDLIETLIKLFKDSAEDIEAILGCHKEIVIKGNTMTIEVVIYYY